MPNRIIREGWIDSLAIDQLDANAERFFLRLCLKADDFGRYHALPQLLKSNLYPLREDVRSADISRWLAACDKAGLVRCYEVASKPFVEIVKFDQRTRAKESKFPPPGSRMSDACLTNGSHPRTYSYSDAETKSETKSLSETARERDGPVAKIQKYEAIKSAYPRTDSPMECLGFIEETTEGGDLDVVLELVQECAKAVRKAPGGHANKYVPNALTFFQKMLWQQPEVFEQRWKVPEPPKIPYKA